MTLSPDLAARLIRRHYAGAQLIAPGRWMVHEDQLVAATIKGRIQDGLPPVPDWLVDVPRLALATEDVT